MEKVRLLILFVLFGVPIIFLPFMHNAFELPKILFLYFICSVSLCILLGKGYRLHSLRLTHWLFLLLLAWIIISSLFGLSFSQSFWGSYFRMQGILTWICYSVLFFIAGGLFANPKFRILASIAIVVSSVIVSLFAIVQFISLWFLGNTSQVLYDSRIISTFGQPNFLGAFLVMSLPFAWFMLKHHLSSSGLTRGSSWIPAFAGMTICLGILITFSRSAYLGLIALIFIWGFYRYKIALAGLAGIISVFILLLIFLPSLANQQFNRFKVDTLSQWTAENRLVIAQKAIDLIVKRPVAGYGLENFSSVFPAVVKPQDFGLSDIVVDSAHNLFLDLWVQTGIIGLGLFLTIFVLTIVYGFRNCHSDPPAGGEESLNFTKALICVIISFVVIHQFSVLSVVPLTIFWISMGAINGSVIHEVSNVIPAKAGIHTITQILGIMLIIFVSFFIVQTVKSDYYFHQASAYEVTDINKAIGLDNKAIKIAPWIEFYKVRRDFLLKQLGLPQ